MRILSGLDIDDYNRLHSQKSPAENDQEGEKVSFSNSIYPNESDYRDINSHIKIGNLNKYHWGRAVIARKLLDVGLSKQANRYIRCGAKIMKFRDQNGVEYFKPYRCELRICPHCQRIASTRKKNKYREVIKYLEKTKQLKGGYRWRLITLTFKKNKITDFIYQVKNANKMLKNLWKRLKRMFGKQIGMITSMEIGKNGGVHFHGLYYGPYIEHENLKKMWKDITGTSYIVDIRLVKGGLYNAVKEVLKYNIKINQSMDIEYFPQIIKALFRIRTVNVLGIFYNKIKYVRDILEVIKIKAMNGIKYLFEKVCYDLVPRFCFFLPKPG